MVPRAVLMKSGLVSVNTARQVNAAHSKTTVNAARPMSYLSKIAHSTVKRPIHKNTTFKNNNINQRVNTVRGKNVNTARPKAVVNVVKGNNFNVVKASACWGNPQMDLKDQGVIDSGSSRLMTGNMSYLTDYEEIDWSDMLFFGEKSKGREENHKKMVTIKTATKDETSGILKSFIIGIENLVDHKVKGANRTLIDAARTMLADSKLPTIFWAEAVNTACYVQNRVLVVKPHNKTSYELFHGRTPTLSFMRPFGCPVTILNTIDHLGKFDGKADKGFFVGYSLNSKAFRVFNSRTRIGEENLHIRFSENIPNVVGSGPDWLFDIDALTRTMNYEPIATDPKSSHDDGSKPSSDDGKKVNVVGGKTSIELPFDLNMPALEDYSIFNFSRDDEDDGAMADMNNLHKQEGCQRIWRNMGLLVLFNKEPKKIIHALKDPSWIEAMQEELLQFKLQEIWTLVDLLIGKRAIGSKWVFRNKKDEMGIMIRNKARLVGQGYTQEEGIDYDEVFAPVTRIEAIRLFLAYASFKDFVVYQMDVKSAFLYGKIEKEVYVCQPPGFEDPDFPDRVYKVEKALYGLHQALRAWYETLSTYLLDNGFQREKIDKTLFIKRHKGDILLVQVYVDDIIFGSTKKELCFAFEKLMHEKFQMNSMGELTFFLGLQVKQKKDGIFISQDKYVEEILKKFGFTEVKTASTPIGKTQKPGMLKDEDGEEVDVHMYRKRAIGSKCVFKNKKDERGIVIRNKARLVAQGYTQEEGIDYDEGFAPGFLYGKIEEEVYVCKPPGFEDPDFPNRGYKLKKQYMDYIQLPKLKAKKSVKLMMEKLFRMELELMLVKTINGEAQLHALVDGKKIIIIESSIRRDLQLADEEDEAVHKELGDSLVRAATTASSLEAEQDSGNINKTQSKATPNESSSLGTTSGGGPRCQETIGDTIAQTRFENVSKHSNDSLLARGNTLRSDEDRLKLDELWHYVPLFTKPSLIGEDKDHST
ncbi:putative ribonuclease H-like domain-containing protein [Tanacetum coccineum]|uniref:Ribonuclease H-like domain-containing protein n=1 Tax=Tanacetum coccineum TaxID=301880 RepID=A0ABQ5J913_9ASTR